MASSKKKAKTKGKAAASHKPAPKAHAAQKPVKKGPDKSKAPAAKGPAPGAEAAARPAAAARPVAGARPAAGARPVGGGDAPKPPARRSRKSGAPRRGPSGEIVGVGEILLPGGTQTQEEAFYLFRGCVAAEHPAGDAGVAEILAKRAPAGSTPADTEGERAELTRIMQIMAQRFDNTIEPLLPTRPQTARRTFQTVQERARLRRREIGAFLRGLDIGRTESSHMDSHGEASLQTLMEWAARLENLSEADEPDQADYAQFHRGLDQLENTTEALIVDVEATLRRLRDRVRAS